MTKEKKKELINKGYCDYWGDYDLSILINEVFVEEWTNDLNNPNFFDPPENMLTFVGKEFIKNKKAATKIGVFDGTNNKINRLITLRIFKTAKERFGSKDSLLLSLQKAIENENYELATQIKKQIEIYEFTR